MAGLFYTKGESNSSPQLLDTNGLSHLAEFKAVERYIKLPLLAEARGYTTDQGLHIQCDQSGWVPQRREAQAAGGWSLCLQVSSTNYFS